MESIRRIQQTFEHQTDNLQNTRTFLEQTRTHIGQVQESVHFLKENMDKLKLSKNVILENMGELEQLGANNYEATELIVSDFGRVVKNTGKMTSTAFELSHVNEELKRVARACDKEQTSLCAGERNDQGWVYAKLRESLYDRAGDQARLSNAGAYFGGAEKI